eukprot:scaffold81103_cov28-Tisochrysis_lutea.AAC.1
MSAAAPACVAVAWRAATCWAHRLRLPPLLLGPLVAAHPTEGRPQRVWGPRRRRRQQSRSLKQDTECSASTRACPARRGRAASDRCMHRAALSRAAGLAEASEGLQGVARRRRGVVAGRAALPAAL